jgi:hypothetical protein
MRALFCFLAASSCLLFAQRQPDFWPNTSYDPAIPTHKKVLGYEPGVRISSHANIMKYMEALASAAPSRMKVVEYGQTWEGRKLIYAAVGSEANIRRLSDIQAAMKRLADPRKTTEAEAQKIMANLPAVIWLGYGVHGNEISSPDAAMLTAYHLLAARNDALVQKILGNVVVLLDPIQNPDGRDRFVHNFEQAEGIEADPSPAAAEHNEPWPGGRTNHYYFDMNRDWFAMTQPETRGRVKALLDWYPLVFVDLHEMGSDSTYYFAPEAVPYNPHLEKNQRDALTWFGKNNAKYFDQYGFNYFTREVYDAFYPGYGASWPSYYGSVAMTYEQASARGLAMRRSDDTTFTFRDTVRQHFVASIATAETSAVNREKLLQNFYNYRKTAIEEGKTEKIREYILPRRNDTSQVDKLAALLAAQGIEVKRATSSFKAGDAEMPAGSYVISTAQPSKRFIRTLLDADVSMEPEFLKEQEARRRRKLPDEIYDVTGWSLPMLYNVECIERSETSTGTFEDVKPGASLPGKVNGGKATVAYLVPWGNTASARFLAGALRSGLRIHTADRGFVQGPKKYNRGTLIVRIADNPADVHDTVSRLAYETGINVDATSTGWVEEGVNFGSRYVPVLKKPSIVLAWDQPTGASAAGHTRFVLERQFGYPVTVIRTQALFNSNELSRYNVLILPESFGNYANTFGAAGIERLKAWVASGGTVIAIGSAIDALADTRVGLLAVNAENVFRSEAAKKLELVNGRAPGKLIAKEEEFESAIRADAEPPDSVAGVLVRAKSDPDHWLTAGAPDRVYALVNGRSIYTPIKLDKGVNASYFLGPDQLLASGYLWEENRKQLAYKPFVIHQPQGRGQVIAFTADPNFRAYMDGLHVLFANAVLKGPGHAR